MARAFPLHISPPVQEDTPHRDLAIGEHEKAEAHRFVHDVIGCTHGNHVDDSVAVIERVVEPALTAELERLSVEAVRRALLRCSIA